jgi:hypothetical protein
MAGPINGILGAFPQPGHWGRNESGNFWVQPYQGDYNSIQLLAVQLAQTLGLSYEVSELPGGLARLEVHYPWNNTPNAASTDVVIKWEYLAAESEKDLLEAQLEVPNVVGSLNQGQIQAIRSALQNPPTATVSIPDPSNPANTISVDQAVSLTLAYFQGIPADPSGNAGNAANALALYLLMAQGVRSHPVLQPILRRTMITNQNYAVAMSLLNVRKIISTSSLVSLENVDQDSLFYDPTSGQLLLPQDVSSTPSLAYGWFKGFPQVQEIALQKWSIQQEWKYGLWATLIWGTPL